MGSGILTTVKSNDLSSVMAVIRHGSRNGVIKHMLQIGESAIYKISIEAIISCLNIKPVPVCFYLTAWLRLLIKLAMASQKL